MKEIWVDGESHTIPMVCFGTKKDHLVISPMHAREFGKKLIDASEEAVALINKRVDEALLEKERNSGEDQRRGTVAPDDQGAKEN